MGLSPIVIGCVHSHAASILPFKEVLSVSLTNSKFRRLHHFVAFCFWVSLQPLLLTAFYAYPAVDDYAMGRATHLAYQSSGSLLTSPCRTYEDGLVLQQLDRLLFFLLPVRDSAWTVF